MKTTRILSVCCALLYLSAVLCAQPDLTRPRLLFSEGDFDRLKAEVEHPSSKAFASLHHAQMEAAYEFVAENMTVPYKKDASGKRILTQSRRALARIFACSYAYKVSGDRRFLDYAEKVINDVCDFPDWNPTHFLDVAEMGLAVAIGYDWLYDSLSEQTRQKAAQRMYEYNMLTSFEPKFTKWVNADTNWNQVCNAGCTAVALAIYEQHPQEAQQVIQRAITTDTRAVTSIYAPDGLYPEGAGYWDYGTNFQIVLNTLLTRAYGNDMGLSELPGFPNTGRFFMYSQGNVGKRFDYSDTKSFAFTFRQGWYFADRFNDPGCLYLDDKAIREAAAQSKDPDMSERLSPLFVMYASRYKGAPIAQPEQKMFYGGGHIPVVIARTGWEKDDIYLGIKGGKAHYSHGHLDVGSFVYEADGVRWSSESHVKGSYPVIEKLLKKVDGKLFSYGPDAWRWEVFSYRNVDHSTLTVNGKLHNPAASGIFTEIFEQDDRMGATIDLTEVLKPEVAGAVRTVEIVDGSYLRVTDVVTAGRKAAKVRFNIMSDALSEATQEGVKLSAGGVIKMLSATGVQVKYQTWSADPKDYPNEVNSEITLEDGRSVCGYTYTVPAGKTVTVVTTLR